MTSNPSFHPPIGAMRLIGDSFRLLFANFGVLFPLALAPVLLLEAALLAFQPAVEPGEPLQITTGVLVISVVGALTGYLIMAMICLAAMDRLTGARRGLDEYVRRAVRHILPLFVIGTLLSIAAGLAMLILVLPGFYVLAQFLVWLPCVVFENAGMGGLGRAQALTRGYRWPLVGALLVLTLLLVGGLMIAMPLFAAAAAGPGELVFALAGALFEAFIYAVFSIFVVLAYVRLREIKEGVSARDLVVAE